jgi:staphylococcal nuclease domain-containing protein 1
MEKKQIIKGLIKGVPSGDHVLIHKSTKTGPAKEIPAYLASIIAPKMGSTNRVEEPFAFDAREFLREKIIGKKCEFIQEYTYSGREYGTLMIENENMNLALVKQGLAKVLEKKGNMATSSNYEDLMNA